MGSTMVHATVYGTGPIFVAVAWTRDKGGGEVGIGGAMEHHRELMRGNGSQVLSSSLLAMKTSRRKTRC